MENPTFFALNYVRSLLSNLVTRGGVAGVAGPPKIGFSKIGLPPNIWGCWLGGYCWNIYRDTNIINRLLIMSNNLDLDRLKGLLKAYPDFPKPVCKHVTSSSPYFLSLNPDLFKGHPVPRYFPYLSRPHRRRVAHYKHCASYQLDGGGEGRCHCRAWRARVFIWPHPSASAGLCFCSCEEARQAARTVCFCRLCEGIRGCKCQND